MGTHGIKLSGFPLPVLLMFVSCTSIQPLSKALGSRNSDHEVSRGNSPADTPKTGITPPGPIIKTDAPPASQASPVVVTARPEVSAADENTAVRSEDDADEVNDKKVQSILDEALEFCQASQEF